MKAIYRPPLEFSQLKDATDTLIQEYEQGGEVNPSWDDGLWQASDIRGALHAMHGECCAYCQGPLTNSDRGDVEHFRPKSIYWWLAYSFDNYFLSCLRCNRFRKRKRFPLAEGESGLSYGDGRTRDQEARLLMDPSLDDVNKIALRLSGSYWSLVGRRDHLGEPDAQAETTIDLFELNLGDHPKHRQRAIAGTLELADRARRNEAPAEDVKRAASRFQPFGGFIRRILENGGYSDLLPNVAEEVQLFLTELLLDLERYDAILADHPGHKDTKNLKMKALWATAVLSHWPLDPLTKVEVESWISEPYRSESAELLETLGE